MHFVVGLGSGEHADKQVRLYHVDGTLVHTFEGHTAAVYAVAVTPDGQHIISGSDDHLVKVWSVATKSLVSTCECGGERVLALAVMPGGARFVSCSSDRTAKLWTLHDGPLERTFAVGSAVDCIAALPDGVHFVVGTSVGFYYNNEVRLYHVDGTLVHTFKGHNGYVAVSYTHLTLPTILLV